MTKMNLSVKTDGLKFFLGEMFFLVLNPNIYNLLIEKQELDTFIETNTIVPKYKEERLSLQDNSDYVEEFKNIVIVEKGTKIEIDESSDLKDQSIKLLEEMKKKQKDSDILVNKIIEDSKTNTVQYEKELKQRLKSTLEKREKNFQQRINNEIFKAEQDIKELIIVTSIYVTQKRIEKNISTSDNNNIILNSLKKINF